MRPMVQGPRAADIGTFWGSQPLPRSQSRSKPRVCRPETPTDAEHPLGVPEPFIRLVSGGSNGYSSSNSSDSEPAQSAMPSLRVTPQEPQTTDSRTLGMRVRPDEFTPSSQVSAQQLAGRSPSGLDRSAGRSASGLQSAGRTASGLDRSGRTPSGLDRFVRNQSGLDRGTVPLEELRRRHNKGLMSGPWVFHRALRVKISPVVVHRALMAKTSPVVVFH